MYEIVVPYRQESIADRERNREHVVEHLEQLGVPVHLVDAPAGCWSPGAARNAGALGLVDAPVIVFCDADTVAPHLQIERAAELAFDGPGLVFGYTIYCRLSRQATLEVLAGDQLELLTATFEQTIVGSPSMGCAAISLESFRKVGGFPEWPGWGYEDLEFAGRCASRWPISRVDGAAFHLWHGERRSDDSPLDSDPLEVVANLHRWQEIPDRPAAA